LSRIEVLHGAERETRESAALIQGRSEAGAKNEVWDECKMADGLISSLKCAWQYLFFNSAGEATLQLSCALFSIKAFALGQSNKKLIATIKSTI
jgi:hypothetical protein